MGFFFTSESVSEGHPDKVADQISDAVLDNLLAYDPDSKVACETLVTTGQVVVAGEVKSNAYIDLQEVARDTINKIGYTKSSYKFDGESCGVLNAIHEQSSDINRGVEREKPEEQGAGDQGMMFGYATNETANCMPLSLDLSHRILRVLADIRREGKEMTYTRVGGKVVTYLRPDAKSQVTIEYGDDSKPKRIHTIVVSTQHDEFILPGTAEAATQEEAAEQGHDREARTEGERLAAAVQQVLALQLRLIDICIAVDDLIQGEQQEDERLMQAVLSCAELDAEKEETSEDREQ